MLMLMLMLMLIVLLMTIDCVLQVAQRLPQPMSCV